MSASVQLGSALLELPNEQLPKYLEQARLVREQFALVEQFDHVGGAPRPATGNQVGERRKSTVGAVNVSREIHRVSNPMNKLAAPSPPGPGTRAVIEIAPRDYRPIYA